MTANPAGYTIDHEGLFLDIKLIETERLLIHEDTIPHRLERLRRRINRDGVQSAPILVDRNSLVVLDGMHRTAVMSDLDCRFTCVCARAEVIDVATKKQVFTPKATRHRLPARPLGVNVPLSLLRDKEISLEEANRILAQHLAKKKVKRYDHGMKWMGRAYDEVLYVFSDL